MMQKTHQLQYLATLGDGKPTSKQRAACVKFVGLMFHPVTKKIIETIDY